MTSDEREDWVKSYRNPSLRFERLPLLTRGFFRELMTKCSRDGRFDFGTKDRAVLWQYINTEPRERRGLGARLDALIENGSIIEHEWGWEIPNFQRYQRRKTKRREQSNGVQSVDTGHALGVQSASTRRANGVQSAEDNHAESLDPDPQRRGEERREEESSTPLPPEGGHRSLSGGDLDLPSEALQALWIEAYQRVKGHRPGNLDRVGLAASHVVDVAEARGVEWRWLMPGLVALYWAEDWPRKNRATMHSFMAQVERLAAVACDRGTVTKPPRFARVSVMGARVWVDRQTGAEHERHPETGEAA